MLLPIRPIRAFIPLLPLFFCLAEAGADDSMKTRILLLLHQDAKVDLAEIHRTLEAHMSDFSVEILSSYRFDQDCDDNCPSIDSARDLARSIGAAAILEIDFPEKKMEVIILPDKNFQVEQRVVRPIPQSECTVSVACSDAIAVMVRSMLLPRLVGTDQVQSQIEEKSTEMGEDEGVEKTEPPFTRESEEEPAQGRNAPEDTDEFRLTLSLAGAYAPTYLTWIDEYQHGAQARVGIITGSYVEFDVSVDILTSHEIPNTEDVYLSRWPIRMLLSAILPLSKIELGISLGVLVDVTTLGSDETATKEEVYAALPISILFRYRFLKWFGLWLDLGADIYGETIEYSRCPNMNSTCEENDLEELIRVAQVLPRAALGLVFLINLN